MEHKTEKVIRVIPWSVTSRLLHLANADPGDRRSFYELKERLLRRYATFWGNDIQEIVKECWGDQVDEHGDRYGCGPQCRRCGGTGVWERKWIVLQRWHWGGYVFHVPEGRTYQKPESVQIHGRIEHPDYGRASREAELWLYLLCREWRKWWHAVSTSCYMRPGWWPMCRLQKVAMRLRTNFSWRRCSDCNCLFLTWGSGWLVCKTCREPKPVAGRDEVPF